MGVRLDMKPSLRSKVLDVVDKSRSSAGKGPFTSWFDCGRVASTKQFVGLLRALCTFDCFLHVWIGILRVNVFKAIGF